MGPRTDVESAASGASCGLDGMLVGRHYIVFTTTVGARRTSNSCSGTAPAAPRLVRAVERLTGGPSAPDPALASERAAPRPEPGDSWSTAAGVGVVVVGALVVALLLGWLRLRA